MNSKTIYLAPVTAAAAVFRVQHYVCGMLIVTFEYTTRIDGHSANVTKVSTC